MSQLKFDSMLCLLCTLRNTCPNIMIIIITVGTCQYIITTILKLSIWIINNSDQWQCVEIRQCRIKSNSLLSYGKGSPNRCCRCGVVWMCWAGVVTRQQYAALFTKCSVSLSLLAGLVGAVPATMCCCAVTRPPTTAWWQWCRDGDEPSQVWSFTITEKAPTCWKRPRHYAKFT